MDPMIPSGPSVSSQPPVASTGAAPQPNVVVSQALEALIPAEAEGASPSVPIQQKTVVPLPSVKKRAKAEVPPGIPNVSDSDPNNPNVKGNNCYANALHQALLGVPGFLEGLDKELVKEEHETELAFEKRKIFQKSLSCLFKMLKNPYTDPEVLKQAAKFVNTALFQLGKSQVFSDRTVLENTDLSLLSQRTLEDADHVIKDATVQNTAVRRNQNDPSEYLLLLLDGFLQKHPISMQTELNIRNGKDQAGQPCKSIVRSTPSVPMDGLKLPFQEGVEDIQGMLDIYFKSENSEKDEFIDGSNDFSRTPKLVKMEGDQPYPKVLPVQLVRTIGVGPMTKAIANLEAKKRKLESQLTKLEGAAAEPVKKELEAVEVNLKELKEKMPRYRFEMLEEIAKHAELVNMKKADEEIPPLKNECRDFLTKLVAEGYDEEIASIRASKDMNSNEIAFFVAEKNKEKQEATTEQIFNHLGKYSSVLDKARVKAFSDEALENTKKNASKVKFPKDLSLDLNRAYGQPPGKDPALIYRLKSFVVHIGDDLNSGHYVSYRLEADGSWYEFNDDQTRKVPPEELPGLLEQSYCLFYEQSVPQPKAPPKPDVPVTPVKPKTQSEEGIEELSRSVKAALAKPIGLSARVWAKIRTLFKKNTWISRSQAASAIKAEVIKISARAATSLTSADRKALEDLADEVNKVYGNLKGIFASKKTLQVVGEIEKQVKYIRSGEASKAARAAGEEAVKRAAEEAAASQKQQTEEQQKLAEQVAEKTTAELESLIQEVDKGLAGLQAEDVAGKELFRQEADEILLQKQMQEIEAIEAAFAEAEAAETQGKVEEAAGVIVPDVPDSSK